MSVPNYLSSTYYYSRLTRVTDVQEILDELAVLMATAGWESHLSSMRSPVDGSSRCFYADFWGSGTTLNLTVSDQNHLTLDTRQMQISAANLNTVQIFIGQYHICVDSTHAGSTYGEYLAAGILDCYPCHADLIDNYVFLQGTRNSGGTVNQPYWSYVTMFDNAVARHDERSNSKNRYGWDAVFQMPHGVEVFYPHEMFVQPVGESGGYEYMWYAGRGYQRVLVPNNLMDKQGQVKVPIDTGTFGTFRRVAGGYQDVYGVMNLAMRAA